MSIAQRFSALALGLGLALLPATVQAQEQDFSAVEIETVPVAENVYVLLGEGGNIGVSAGPDGVFLIDDQFAPLTEKIRAAIAKISDQPIKFVLNTHWHFDHTGGNENLGNEGTIIVAHDNVYQRMSTDQFIEAFGMEVEPSPKAALPVISFSDTTTFYLNGDRICAFHVDPAHTDGDSIVQFHEANVIHMGDTYFNGIYPCIDTSSGGSIDGMIAAVEEVLELANDETVIIPGHGTISNRAELVVYHNLLKTVRDRIGAAIAQGQTLEQVLADSPLTDLDEKYGQGFLKPEQFLTIIYKGLSNP